MPFLQLVFRGFNVPDHTAKQLRRFIKSAFGNNQI